MLLEHMLLSLRSTDTTKLLLTMPPESVEICWLIEHSNKDRFRCSMYRHKSVILQCKVISVIVYTVVGLSPACDVWQFLLQSSACTSTLLQIPARATHCTAKQSQLCQMLVAAWQFPALDYILQTHSQLSQHGEIDVFAWFKEMDTLFLKRMNGTWKMFWLALGSKVNQAAWPSALSSIRHGHWYKWHLKVSAAF